MKIYCKAVLTCALFLMNDTYAQPDQFTLHESSFFNDISYFNSVSLNAARYENIGNTEVSIDDFLIKMFPLYSFEKKGDNLEVRGQYRIYITSPQKFQPFQIEHFRLTFFTQREFSIDELRDGSYEKIATDKTAAYRVNIEVRFEDSEIATSTDVVLSLGKLIWHDQVFQDQSTQYLKNEGGRDLWNSSHMPIHYIRGLARMRTLALLVLPSRSTKNMEGILIPKVADLDTPFLNALTTAPILGAIARSLVNKQCELFCGGEGGCILYCNCDPTSVPPNYLRSHAAKILIPRNSNWSNIGL